MYRILLPKTAFRNGLHIKGILGNAFARSSIAVNRFAARPSRLIALAVVITLGTLVIIL